MQQMQEAQVQPLGWEGPLEQEMATHSGVLDWEIPQQRSLVGRSPWGCKELDTTEQSHSVQYGEVTDVNYTYCGNYFSIYTCIKSLSYIP